MRITLDPAILDRQGLVLDPAELAQAVTKRFELRGDGHSVPSAEKTDPWGPRCLRVRADRRERNADCEHGCEADQPHSASGLGGGEAPARCLARDASPAGRSRPPMSSFLCNPAVCQIRD